MRCLAVQYIHEMATRLGIQGTGVRDVARLFAGLLECCSQTCEHEDLSDTRQRIVLTSCKPFDDDAPEMLRAAMFHFQSMGARILNGRLRATRTADGPGREVWEFEDAGKWLW